MNKEDWLEKLDDRRSGDWSWQVKLLSLMVFVGEVLVEILFTIKDSKERSGE